MASLALDFTSESLKYAVLQNYTQPWISRDLNDYTVGTLTLGYHAAYGGLMKKLGNSSETASFRPTEPVVRTSINKKRLYGWLGLNATLTLSAIMVFFAQRRSKTKAIRDITLAALTMDLTEVTHDSRASGLCNAVVMNEHDRQLPKMKWKKFGTTDEEDLGTMHGCCQRGVAFVEATGTSTVPLNNRIKKRTVTSTALAKPARVSGTMS